MDSAWRCSSGAEFFSRKWEWINEQKIQELNLRKSEQLKRVHIQNNKGVTEHCEQLKTAIFMLRG
jgi:hypothetical protein